MRAAGSRTRARVNPGDQRGGEPDGPGEGRDDDGAITMAGTYRHDASASASATTPAAIVTKHSKHPCKPEITHPARRVAARPPDLRMARALGGRPVICGCWGRPWSLRLSSHAPAQVARRCAPSSVSATGPLESSSPITGSSARTSAEQLGRQYRRARTGPGRQDVRAALRHSRVIQPGYHLVGRAAPGRAQP
jgi:hypothetical protein